MSSQPTAFDTLPPLQRAWRSERLPEALDTSERSRLQAAIDQAREALLRLQDARGCWVFELEADSTIPAEYILLMHFLDEIDSDLEQQIATYLRERQGEHGGWPLYHGGALDVSCTVKVYFALKLAGDSPDAPHMRRAREALLAHGGAARSNVFTRITLALFGQVPWRATPYIPVEIVLLPRWFPFHIDKVSYWSRTVMVPLLILCTLRPKAANPRQVDIRELFSTPPEEERHYFRHTGLLGRTFMLLDRLGWWFDPMIPRALRRRATRRAEQWTLDRLNGEDGLGAIFPAMVNALEAMAVLGYPADEPRRATAKRALQNLLVRSQQSAYCQPCVSPIWDTALAILAMQAEGSVASQDANEKAFDWLLTQQLLEQPGDWQVQRPQLPGGGWAFQFANAYYPDLDDTAAVVWGMLCGRAPRRYTDSIDRALDWLVGMQSGNGGFGAFDVDNTHYALNQIPFADHGALLDPPTSDVTARVVTALALSKRPQDRPALQRALAFLEREQEADGSWFGRWGTNFVYGTWSVLSALEAAGVGPQDARLQRAVAWLVRAQNPDGGWGESNDTYFGPLPAGDRTPSTPFQTAWALLALMAAGESGSASAREGVEYLLRVQDERGLWSHPSFTAPGFPRVFYLKYHGYCAYFPLWALAAYRNRSRARAAH